MSVLILPILPLLQDPHLGHVFFWLQESPLQTERRSISAGHACDKPTCHANGSLIAQGSTSTTVSTY